MVRYINQLICIFMNINENCKNKVKIIKKTQLKQISGSLWCTERRGGQWVKRLKTVVCSITDVSSSYNMTAINAEITLRNTVADRIFVFLSADKHHFVGRLERLH